MGKSTACLRHPMGSASIGLVPSIRLRNLTRLSLLSNLGRRAQNEDDQRLIGEYDDWRAEINESKQLRRALERYNRRKRHQESDLLIHDGIVALFDNGADA